MLLFGGRTQNCMMPCFNGSLFNFGAGRVWGGAMAYCTDVGGWSSDVSGSKLKFMMNRLINQSLEVPRKYGKSTTNAQWMGKLWLWNQTNPELFYFYFYFALRGTVPQKQDLVVYYTKIESLHPGNLTRQWKKQPVWRYKGISNWICWFSIAMFVFGSVYPPGN